MVTATKFADEVRINETHINAGHPALMESPQQGKSPPDGGRTETQTVFPTMLSPPPSIQASLSGAALTIILFLEARLQVLFTCLDA